MVDVVASEGSVRRQGLPVVPGGAPSGGSGAVPEGYRVAAEVAMVGGSGQAAVGQHTADASSAPEHPAEPATQAAPEAPEPVAGADAAAAPASSPTSVSASGASVMSRRQGLPRATGGAPSGGSGAVPEAYLAAAGVDLGDVPQPAASVSGGDVPAATSAAEPAGAHTAPAAAQAGAIVVADIAEGVRRTGLPRIAGGAPAGGSGAVPDGYAVATAISPPDDGAARAAAGAPEPGAQAPAAAPVSAADAPAAKGSAAAGFPAGAGQLVASGEVAAVRREGLPRMAEGAASGGSGAVPAGFAIAERVDLPAEADAEEALQDDAPADAASGAAIPVTADALQPDEAAEPVSEPVTPEPEQAAAVRVAAPSAPAATQGKTAPAKPAKPAKAKKPMDPEKRAQALKMLLAATVGAAVTVLVVMLVRAMLATEPLQAFLTRYPGEYELPETAEPGFPAWVQWTHFLNFFFLVLIVRSGLQVRFQQKPDAYWTPKWSKGGDGKISIAAWFHQSLDVLWLLNGVIFVVLLFVTGHWMRIVPTSWEVFPNALSAILQYISLDWPTEDGWVNYNSLQQIMYFLVVFVAAPLAAVTGVRMSSVWPKQATTLSRVYPVEVARAIHFPTMIFFVGFVIVHVILVFSTGMLRNLNHMFGEGPTTSWVGFWFFIGSIAVTAAAWVAARPMILAMLARLTGKVSAR